MVVEATDRSGKLGREESVRSKPNAARTRLFDAEREEHIL
jgi:hypothetical protein